MSDILTAFSGAKRLLDSGRTVFEKLYDIPNRVINPVFAGADRPEFHKTLDGFEQVCVERHSVNQKTNGSFQGTLGANSPTGWTFNNQGTNGVGEVVESIFEGRQAMKFNVQSGDRAYIEQSEPLSSGTYTLSLIVESFTGDSDRFAWIHNAGANINLSLFKGFDASKPFPQKISFTFNFVEGDGTNFRIGRGTGSAVNASSELVISSLKVEEGSYPTLFHEGTRLAPSPVIENALPETGTVAGVVDMVRDNSETKFIYDSGGSSSTERVSLVLSSTNRFNSIFRGNIGGDIILDNPFSYWNNNERNKIVYITSANSDNIYFWVCDTNGDLYGQATTNTINSTVRNNINIGSISSGGFYSSIRVLIPIRKSTQVIDTAQKAKDYIESLTVGTLNLKASEITHQNP